MRLNHRDYNITAQGHWYLELCLLFQYTCTCVLLQQCHKTHALTCTLNKVHILIVLIMACVSILKFKFYSHSAYGLYRNIQ